MPRPKKKPPRKPAPRPAAAPAASARERDPEELVRDGREAFAAGSYAEAANAWQQALRARPDDRLRSALAEARFRAALATEDAGEAVGLLSQAIDHQPDRAALRYHLGLAYLRRGEPERAAAALRAARERAPEEERVSRHLALALLRWGTAEALAEARELLQAEAPDPHWACLRVAASLRSGDLDAAYGAAARSTASGPVADDLQLARALIDYSQGHRDRGVEALRTLAQHSPGSPPAAAAAYILGANAWDEGDTGAAEARWAEAVAAGFPAPELDALRLQALHVRAAEAAAAGRLEEAASAWQRVLEVSPDDAVARRNLRRIRPAQGDALARAGDIAGAAAAWEEILDAEPGNLDVAHNLALAYERLDREDDAARLWRRIVDSWRKDVRRAEADEETRRRMALAYRHLGWLFGEAGDFRRAIQELRNALRFDPADLEARSLLVDAYLVQDQWMAARAENDKILQQDPGNEAALMNRVVLASKRHDRDQAEAALRAILERNPQHASARRILSGVLSSRIEDAWSGGEAEEVERLIQERVALDPDNPAPYIQAGGIAFSDGDRKKASECFKRALAARDDAETLAHIGRELLEIDEVKEGMRWIRRSAERDSSPEHQHHLVSIMTNTDVPWKSVRPYAEAAAASEDPNVLADIAIDALGAGDSRAALEWATRAAHLDPTHPGVLMALGIVYHRQGDPRAEEVFDEAERQAKESGDKRLLESMRQQREVLRLMRAIEEGRLAPPPGILRRGGIR